MNKIRMNLDAWTYEDYVRFMQAFNKGDNDKLSSLARKLIVSWDYSVPLDSDDAIGELGVAESAELFRTVVTVVTEQGNEIPIDDVNVDFGKWNTRRFFLFDGLRQEGKVKEAEAMLHEIAALEGASPAEPLTYLQGSAMYRAVNEAYKKLVTGKG